MPTTTPQSDGLFLDPETMERLFGIVSASQASEGDPTEIILEDATQAVFTRTDRPVNIVRGIDESRLWTLQEQSAIPENPDFIPPVPDSRRSFRFSWAIANDSVEQFRSDYNRVKQIYNEIRLQQPSFRRLSIREMAELGMRHGASRLSTGISEERREIVDDFVSYFRENYDLGVALIHTLGFRSRFSTMLLNTRSKRETESMKVEKLIREIKSSKNKYNLVNYDIGSIVMVGPGDSSVGRIYEVVGFRSGRAEVMVSPLGFERRGNVRRFSNRQLFLVGSSWPLDEEIELIEEKSFEFIKDKETKSRFYREYQIGIEIEGEFHRSPGEIESNTDGYFNEGNIVHDGSIYPQKGGYIYEINSPLIDTVGQEENFLTNMALIAKERGNERSPFSSRNNTAGTHVHFDVNRYYVADFLKKYDLPVTENITASQYLRFLDSMEFEKFFFREYFRYFKMKKFWGRLSNNYCRAFLKKVGLVSVDESTRADEVESLKQQQGKYKWLNFKSLDRRMGIEFRIFPYLTTARGIKNVIEFTQWVVMSYMEKYATHDKLMVIFETLQEADSRHTAGLGFDFGHKDRRTLEKFFGNEYLDVRNCSYDGMVLYNSIKKKLEQEKKKHV